MNTIKASVIIISFYFTTVIAFNIIGVLANSLLDIFAGRSKSTLLYYTVWFVTAIFAGCIYFLMATDYIKANTFYNKNSWFIITVSIILSAFAIYIFNTDGQMQNQTFNINYYVPGNKSMTYTYFITFNFAAIFVRYANNSKKNKLTNSITL